MEEREREREEEEEKEKEEEEEEGGGATNIQAQTKTGREADREIERNLVTGRGDTVRDGEVRHRKRLTEGKQIRHINVSRFHLAPRAASTPN